MAEYRLSKIAKEDLIRHINMGQNISVKMKLKNISTVCLNASKISHVDLSRLNLLSI